MSGPIQKHTTAGTTNALNHDSRFACRPEATAAQSVRGTKMCQLTSRGASCWHALTAYSIPNFSHSARAGAGERQDTCDWQHTTGIPGSATINAQGGIWLPPMNVPSWHDTSAGDPAYMAVEGLYNVLSWLRALRPRTPSAVMLVPRRCSMVSRCRHEETAGMAASVSC